MGQTDRYQATMKLKKRDLHEYLSGFIVYHIHIEKQWDVDNSLHFGFSIISLIMTSIYYLDLMLA